MRLSRSTSIALSAAILFVTLASRGGAEPLPVAGGRAALVNGSLITAEAFRNELKRVERQNLREKRSLTEVSRKQVLENLIVRELLYQEALRQGVRVPSGEITAQLAQLSYRLPGGGESERALDRMGLSTSVLEGELARGLVIRRFLVRSLSAGAVVSDDDVAGYYRGHQDDYRVPLRFRLSHILVKVAPFPSYEKMQELRGKLEAVRRRVVTGEDFAALAREGSDCQSAKNGGDLGYFLSGQLSRKLEGEALRLKPGEVSGIVEDRFGLHLLKLTELRPEAVLPLSEVKEQIRDQIKEKRLQPKDLQRLVARLRAAARVEILLNEDQP